MGLERRQGKKLKNLLIIFYYYLILRKFTLIMKMSNEFVGHPLLDETTESKIDINQILEKNKALISIFPGSRISEINILMPILLEFIELMNKSYEDFVFIFHSTKEHLDTIKYFLNSKNIKNCEIISDDIIKSHTLKKSVFAVAKSGTISLEICKSKIPSIILYKMNFLNYLIVRSLVKVKFANIINIAAKEEVIPELLQSKCNPKNLFKVVSSFIDDPNKIKEQVEKTQTILNKFKTNISSAELASRAIIKFLR